MTRDDHDRVLGTYTRPAALIATKASSDSDLFCEGEEADLRHDVWFVRTDDPAKKRNPERPLAFDQVIDVGRVRLNSPAHIGDLLTLKIWALEIMRGQYLPPISAGTMLTTFNSALWILRWRASLPKQHFRALSEPLFENYCKRLKGGSLALIPFEQRLAAMCGEVESGNWAWPILTYSGRVRLDSSEVAERLGMSIAAARSMPRFVSAVDKAARKDAAVELGSRSGVALEQIANGAEGANVDGRESETIAVETVRGTLTVWRDLYRLSQVGVLSHDALNFDPFASISLEERCRQIGRAKSGRTETIGPREWIALLDAAARWVLDYADPLLLVCEKAVAIEKEYMHMSYGGKKYRLRPLVAEVIRANWATDGRPTLLPIWTRAGGASTVDQEGLALNEAVKHLIAACFILIGAMSARRVGEMDSLQKGCVTRDAFGECWLSSYIEKTIRDIDQLPVPATVGRAVLVLETLSESGRARTSEPWLSNIDRPNASLGEYQDRLGFNLSWGPLINGFAEMAGVSGLELGENWRFAAHQLRRGFSIYYYHGNRYSNFDALSRFLRHFDPEMTRVYVTELFGGTLGRLSELARAHAKMAADAERRAQESADLAAEAEKARKLADMAADAVFNLKSRMSAHEEVRQEAGVERMLEVHDGIEAPIGVGAARLYADLDEQVERARRQIRLERPSSNVSPEDVREALPDQLKRHVKTHYLEPVSGGFAHCRCRPGVDADLQKAVCLVRKREETGITDDKRPDYAFASIEDCLGECPHGLALSENQRVVQKVIQRGTAAQNPNAIVDSIVASVTAAKAAVAGRGG